MVIIVIWDTSQGVMVNKLDWQIVVTDIGYLVVVVVVVEKIF